MTWFSGIWGRGALGTLVSDTDEAGNTVKGILPKIQNVDGSGVAIDYATATLQGALTETAPATDTASSGLNGRLQRIAQRLTSVIAKQPALGTAGAASTDVLTVQGIASGTPLIIGGNVAAGTADSGNPVKMGGVYNSTLPTYATGQRGDLQIGTKGSLNVTIMTSNGTASVTAAGDDVDAVAANSSALKLVGVSRTTVFNGTSWDRARGDTNGMVMQAAAMSSSRFSYAAPTGGIVNTTTGVTFIAAAGASVRNYVSTFQFDWDALGAATEVAIRDGAGGTVLWRMKIPAGVAGMREVVLTCPIKSTANTLLEVVTLTASVTGGVFFNAQGHQGA